MQVLNINFSDFKQAKINHVYSHSHDHSLSFLDLLILAGQPRRKFAEIGLVKGYFHKMIMNLRRLKMYLEENFSENVYFKTNIS